GPDLFLGVVAQHEHERVHAVLAAQHLDLLYPVVLWSGEEAGRRLGGYATGDVVDATDGGRVPPGRLCRLVDLSVEGGQLLRHRPGTRRDPAVAQPSRDLQHPGPAGAGPYLDGGDRHRTRVRAGQPVVLPVEAQTSIPRPKETDHLDCLFECV